MEKPKEEKTGIWGDDEVSREILISRADASGHLVIVDLRPDDEAKDQTPVSAIKQAAETFGMRFHYVPIPSGPVPREAVESLQGALADRTMFTVLYCRTGNRATRALALLGASRTNEPSAVAINTMVRDAGFFADDLKSEIGQRIAQRNPMGESSK